MKRIVRKNTDIDKIIIYYTGGISSHLGKEINNDFLISQSFGVPWDIVINKDGRCDLSARWIYAIKPEQFLEDVSLYQIDKYKTHHLSAATDDDDRNSDAIHIAVVGDFDIEVPSIYQFKALKKLLEYLKKKYIINEISYYRDISKTSNPGRFFFDKSDLGIVETPVTVSLPEFEWLVPDVIEIPFKILERDRFISIMIVIFDITYILAGDHFRTSTVIQWSTDIPTTSQVEYGLTAAYGYETPIDSALTTTHRVVLTGINNYFKYHFRVRSTYLDYSCVSADYVFPNWDDFLTVNNVTGGLLNNLWPYVGWGTNRPATSKVFWGFTSELGNETALDPEHLINHRVKIDLNQIDVTVYFKVQSTTHDGHIATSDIYYFIVGKEIDIYNFLYYELFKNKISINKEINMTVEFSELEKDSTLIPDVEHEEFVELTTEKITVGHTLANEVSIGTEYDYAVSP